MTTDEKDLLVKDICSRLPFFLGGSVDGISWEGEKMIYKDAAVTGYAHGRVVFCESPFSSRSLSCSDSEFKPYLRPMSDLGTINVNTGNTYLDELKILAMCTKQDALIWGGTLELFRAFDSGKNEFKPFDQLAMIDYLTKNMFDYRGLIEMGLAIDINTK